MAKIVPLEPGQDPTHLPTRSTGGGGLFSLFSSGGNNTWIWGLALVGMALIYFFVLRPANAKAQAQLHPPTATPVVMTATAMMDAPLQLPTASPTGPVTATSTPNGYWNMFPDKATATGPAAAGSKPFTLPTIPPVVINKEVTRVVPVEVTRVVQVAGQPEIKVVVVTMAPVQQTVIVTATPLPSSTPAPTQTPWIVYQTQIVEVVHTVEVTPTATATLTPTITQTPGPLEMAVTVDPETPTPTLQP